MRNVASFCAVIFFIWLAVFIGALLYPKRGWFQGNTVLIADNSFTRMRGLSGRVDLREDGMLFVFEEPSKVTFWNKRCLRSIRADFYDAETNLVDSIEFPPESAGLVRVHCDDVRFVYECFL